LGAVASSEGSKEAIGTFTSEFWPFPTRPDVLDSSCLFAALRRQLRVKDATGAVKVGVPKNIVLGFAMSDLLCQMGECRT
jgi:hypothetical protein